MSHASWSVSSTLTPSCGKKNIFTLECLSSRSRCPLQVQQYLSPKSKLLITLSLFKLDFRWTLRPNILMPDSTTSPAYVQLKQRRSQ